MPQDSFLMSAAYGWHGPVIHGKNMTGIDICPVPVLHYMKPLRRRSNRRRTHREDGAWAESPLAANRQMDRRGRAERGRGDKEDEPISMARRRASVNGLRACRRLSEVGGFYPSNKVVPQMYFHASVLVRGQVRFYMHLSRTLASPTEADG